MVSARFNTQDMTDIGHRLLIILDTDGPGELDVAASSLHQADLAEGLTRLNETERRRLLLAIPPELAARALEELDPELRDEFTDDCSDDDLIRIISAAAADVAVYFLDHLSDERAQTLIARLDQSLREKLEEQLELDEDSAGHMMQRDVMTLRPFETARQALDRIRSRTRPYNGALFVIDGSTRLVGVVGLRDLVVAEPDRHVRDIMNARPKTAQLDDDRETVIDLMQSYHFRSVPILDGEKRLRGQVTWDDAFDALEAEADEDILALAGTSEDLEENAGVIKRAAQRLPYLLLTAAGGFVMAKLIHGQSDAILKHFPLLLAFLPLVPALGGNIGIQCSTVTVRSIATGELSPSRILTRTLRELGTGSLLAFVLSIVCGLGATVMMTFTEGGTQKLSAIIAISLLLAILVAAGFGVFIPLACLKLKIDPAIAAGPFITMLNDITGVSIYLATSSVLLHLLAQSATP